jgi:streptogramin lyase
MFVSSGMKRFLLGTLFLSVFYSIALAQMSPPMSCSSTGIPGAITVGIPAPFTVVCTNTDSRIGVVNFSLAPYSNPATLTFSALTVNCVRAQAGLTIKPNDYCTVTGNLTASNAGTYTLDFKPQYSGTIYSKVFSSPASIIASTTPMITAYVEPKGCTNCTGTITPSGPVPAPYSFALAAAPSWPGATPALSGAVGCGQPMGFTSPYLILAPIANSCEVSAAFVAEYPVSTANTLAGITAGQDGTLWFTGTDTNGAGLIGHITTTGVISLPFTGLAYTPQSITVAPDGTLWFTGSDNSGAGLIGKITTAGVISTPFMGLNYSLRSITVAPNGTSWFTGTDTNGAGLIGKVTAGVLSTPFTSLSYIPQGITTISNNTIWFTGTSNFGTIGLIGQITPAGVLSTPFNNLSYTPQGITAASTGTIWFTGNTNGVGLIGKITAGALMEFSTLTDTPQEITPGPEGNLWFTEYGHIGKITPLGTVTEYPSNFYTDIIKGPDGNLWFVSSSGVVGVL